TREPDGFAASHLPDSINIWLDGLSLYPGWTLEYDQNILLVTERKEDVETAEAYLQRLGFDNIIGYLCVGIKGWRNQGKTTDSLGTLSVDSLKKKMDENEIVLVDVRDPVEWKEGHIEGAENIYVGHLRDKAEQLPNNKPVATTCGWGGRGGLGASILKKIGMDEVYNVLGGVKAWKSKGYPLKMED
ncbi:MAG: rhodanese-like domain-containing protein, partial [Thermoproteota archaeon]